MRRPNLLVGLIVIFALTARIQAQLAPAQAKNGAAARAGRAPAADRAVAPAIVPSSVPVKNPSWDVTGRGNTPEEAEQAALDNAVEKVHAYLTEQEPSFQWLPSPEYVRDRLVKSRKNQTPEPRPEPVGVIYPVTLHVELDHSDQREMLEKDRDERILTRQKAIGKWLVVFVAFLTAITGYLRLDEATKGYYTGLLRLAAVTLIGGVSAGLWWIS